MEIKTVRFPQSSCCAFVASPLVERIILSELPKGFRAPWLRFFRAVWNIPCTLKGDTIVVIFKNKESTSAKLAILTFWRYLLKPGQFGIAKVAIQLKKDFPKLTYYEALVLAHYYAQWIKYNNAATQNGFHSRANRLPHHESKLDVLHKSTVMSVFFGRDNQADYEEARALADYKHDNFYKNIEAIKQSLWKNS